MPARKPPLPPTCFLNLEIGSIVETYEIKSWTPEGKIQQNDPIPEKKTAALYVRSLLDKGHRNIFVTRAITYTFKGFDGTITKRVPLGRTDAAR